MDTRIYNISNEKPKSMPIVLRLKEDVRATRPFRSNIGTLINQVEKKDRIKFFTFATKKEGFNTRFYNSSEDNILIYLFLCIIVLGIICCTPKKKYMTFNVGVMSLLLVVIFSNMI
jgi:hypothetical protein